MKFTLTGIILLTVMVISLSFFGTTHAYFNSQQITGPHLISTWESYLWTQTTEADFSTGVPDNVNIRASPGSVILNNRTVGASIFATRGSSTNFLQYYLSNDTWVARANTPASVGLGGGVRHIGLGNISGVRGSNTNNFWIYNISSDTIHFGLKPLRRFTHAALVDLAEEELSLLPVANDGSVTISATGHKIVSVLFSE
ncbi:MAG: hypothetical protein MUF37_08985 [Methanoregulaceae archaeon]|nr:hypothetical protein [Methanoregulaceae archaeon]